MRVAMTLVILLGWMVSSFAQSDSPSSPLLGPGDVVQIEVFGFHPYGGEFQVFDDGTISGVGFGRLKAEGLTVSGLETRVSAALRKTLKNTAVRITLKTKKRAVVYVVSLGAVERPGLDGETSRSGPVPILPGMNLRQLLAIVALPGDPDLLDATLHRKDGIRIEVDLLKLVRGEPGQWNGLIEADDTLTILPKPFIRVWLMGNVKAPGEARVRQGVDVYQALAENGGLDLSGNLVDELVLSLRRGPEVRNLPARPQGSGGVVLEAGDVVTIEAPKKVRVVVGGEVVVPGEYMLPAGSRIGRLVAEARGMSPDGTLAHVLVMRGADVFRVDATGPVSGASDAEFQLDAGDFVYVMRNERAVYATGQVRDPGRHLIPDGKEWTATDLLAAAKGISAEGTLRRVVLLRPDAAGKVVATQFNLDEYLKDGRVESNPKVQPGDVLYFGQPKGLTTSAFPFITQAAFYLDAIFRGR